MLIQTGQKTGSGLAVGDGTLVLTVASLLEGRIGVTVHHDDGTSATGFVLARDVQRDLGVIRLQSKEYTSADTGFQGVPALGENVAAIGYPQEQVGFSSITRGIVTSIRADTEMGTRFIETDAPVRPGNWGGPLISLQGEILGVIVSEMPLLQGEPVESHACVISMDDIRRALEEMGIPLD